MPCASWKHPFTGGCLLALMTSLGLLAASTGQAATENFFEVKNFRIGFADASEPGGSCEIPFGGFEIGIGCQYFRLFSVTAKLTLGDLLQDFQASAAILPDGQVRTGETCALQTGGCWEVGANYVVATGLGNIYLGAKGDPFGEFFYDFTIPAGDPGYACDLVGVCGLPPPVSFGQVGNAYTATFAATVPLPAALPMLGFGIGALVWRSRRQKPGGR